jgi:hypothetical protein
MTIDNRNTILETVDILRALGGQNGFSNLQPKMKKLLLQKANALKKIVEDDIRGQPVSEEFDGETVYVGGSPEDWKVHI